ncbi:MAG TPA: STAS domain-containing protein [Terriglobales bacterium]|nr:STAS domain-containing protein [Terriglobales bacterium]
MLEKPLQVRVTPGRLPSSTVIAATGALVLEHVITFQDAWKAVPAGAVIFDLSGVVYMDSSALGSLVNAHVFFSQQARRIALAGVTDRVLQLLKMTRVETLFAIFPNVEAAETSINSAASA